MDPLFMWLEQTPLSVWVRESPSMFAFPGVLVLHTVGMAFLVGTSMAISLRVLGRAPGVAPATVLTFVPLMWLGFSVNAVSGVALLVAYPTKALTNPLFYLKLALIALAIAGTRHLTRNVLGARRPHEGAIPSRARVLAGVTLVLWVAAITSGRLLAYTYTRLMATGYS